MLIFFDIDATLIRTGGVGMKAMTDAGRGLFGSGFDQLDGVQFAGRLDPLILEDLLEANGQTPSPENIQAMRETYGNELRRRLEEPDIGLVLPGVFELIDALDEMEDTMLGLLTGNFEETGRMKLEACGIDLSRFVISVWGDESPHDPPARDHLPEVGMARFEERIGRKVDPREVAIIGDTPHDVSCARANGCRSVGVATGMHSRADLILAGANLVLEDLSETEAIVGWLSAISGGRE